MRAWCGVVGLGLGLVALHASRAQESRLSDYYGFLTPEIYKLENRIHGLALRDLDGDGTADVIVVNNARSRIDLLLSRPSGAASRPESGDDRTNRIRNDRRMRLVSVPVNREVVSLRVGDLNGDGKLDLAYYGTPADLMIRYNRGGAEFGDPVRIHTGEAVESPNALAVGDLDRDGRDDLALLRAEEVVLVRQRKGGGPGDPERLPHTAAKPSMLQITDLDGDGGRDLVLLGAGPEDPVRVRFSTEDGQLGPEERLALETPRAIAFAPLDERPGSELLGIESKSGRMKVFSLAVPDKEDVAAAARRGRLLIHPLRREGARGRVLAVGDLDGDGWADVVVTDPASAEVLVYRQAPGGLAAPRTFPGLAGTRTIRAADLDGDGKSEVLVLSDTEKQVAVSRLENDRLGFPSALPTRGEPVALDVGDLDGDGKAEVLYAVAAGKLEGGNPVFTLRALRQAAPGEFRPFRWGEAAAVEVRSLNSAPPAIRVLDADGDGQPDLLVFNEYGTPVLLVGRRGAAPVPWTGGMGPLANAPAPAASPAGRLGPGLLVSQNTYVRQVVLDPNGRWSVQGQFNAGSNDARIVGAAALGGEGGGKPEIALLDRSTNILRRLAERDGAYQPGEPQPIGPLDFQGLSVADFDGDGREDLLLADTDRFAVVLTAQPGPRLRPLAAYESAREEAHLGDLVTGDVNGDGRPDIVMTDTGEHFLEIAAFRAQPGPALLPALAFKVYERKSFRDPGRNVEPRALAVGDIDGDKRDDIVLLVHDRVLVFRQDPGPKDQAK